VDVSGAVSGAMSMRRENQTEQAIDFTGGPGSSHMKLLF
jgi:hypothetical protein